MKWIVMLTLIVSGIAAPGQPAITSFALTNVADGSKVSLDSYSSMVVVIFTGNECAFANYYTERIKSMIDAYAGKVQFLLINAHIAPEESSQQMSAKYAAWGLRAPYLADKDQLAMDILGAKKSPEAFLLQNTDGRFVVAYKGLIDDNPQVPSDVKQNYLKENIDKVLAGQKITVPETRAIGCSIRKK